MPDPAPGHFVANCDGPAMVQGKAGPPLYPHLTYCADKIEITGFAGHQGRVTTDRLVDHVEAGGPLRVRNVLARGPDCLEPFPHPHDTVVGITGHHPAVEADAQDLRDHAIVNGGIISSRIDQREFDVLEDVDVIARHPLHSEFGRPLVFVRMNDILTLEEPLRELLG